LRRLRESEGRKIGLTADGSEVHWLPAGYLVISGYQVTPVVAWSARGFSQSPVSRWEVADVLRIPLKPSFSPQYTARGRANFQTARCRSTIELRLAKRLGSNGGHADDSLSDGVRGAARMKDDTAIARLIEIMARLRDPQAGCPWDREQTFETIVPTPSRKPMR